MFTRIALAAMLVSTIAACQPRQPQVVTTPGAVAPEPVYQGKYGAN